MGVRDPEHFLIHVKGTIHIIKEIELDTKFQEAMKAVEPENLEVNLAKMTYKDELKKGKSNNVPQQAVGAGMAAPDKAKKLKKEGDKSPPALAIAAKAAFIET